MDSSSRPITTSASGQPDAPSLATAYISNLPFTLTNNDIHKIFEKHGKIVKVTVVKDKDTRNSKGVAFVLFYKKEHAHACVASTNKSQLHGRTLSAQMAKDNGRTTEFIKRKEYPNKTRCYECGEFGHLSYSCPKNCFGTRQPPKKKFKSKSEFSRKRKLDVKNVEEENGSPIHDETGNDLESLSEAIRYSQELRVAQNINMNNYDSHIDNCVKKYRKSDYFSDEEELE